MHELLDSIAFRDRMRSRREVETALAGLPDETQSQISSLLSRSAAPDRVVRYFGAFRERHPAALGRVARDPVLLQRLLAVFDYSRFLSEELLQHPGWLEEADLSRTFGAELYARRLREYLQRSDARAPALALAQFRRQEILRILLRDVLGLARLPETTEELSNLSDAILEVSFERIHKELIARHGVPQYEDESGQLRECGFAVIALGKLGGRELNYSSDIDLMFLYTANGETSGPARVSNKEFFKKAATQYTGLLSTYTAEGLCYRVDLRLRPEGSLGEVCISVEGAKSYYGKRARDWELQMLIKARRAAGDEATSRALLDFVQPLIYSTTLDFSAIETMSETRERINEKLAARRAVKADFDIKLARGGIRDIEFLVQCLQRLHGGRVPWVRHGGTMLALSRLRDKDLLSGMEHARLAAAYEFLRHLEHRLQFEDDRQTHALPSAHEDLELLAHRMPAAELGSAPSAEGLLEELNRHLESVQEIYERVIHAQKPLYYSAPAEGGAAGADSTEEPLAPEPSNLVRSLDQRAPGLASSLARNSLRRGARAYEHFLEKIVSKPEWLALLDENKAVARYTIDLFEHSPYLAERLIRTPELVEQLTRLHEPSGNIAAISDPTELRRAFQSEVFRIEAASLCVCVPVFETLTRTSDLADAALNAAYDMAVRQILETHPPASPAYEPRRQLLVIALGRLGMREFDVASDADLLFVAPETDAGEIVFWTRVAERIIQIITAYTGAGTLFSVDTRLRPNGSAGALVQSDAAYKEYFARGAEAWEGIAYMKARSVAGDCERATEFLNQLQELDWRRYGQSGRSRKELRHMRLRIEKEQGVQDPLKAGTGGFYDIDFVLMYLRLKSAGIFFKVLNTPERIDIIEKMGHLDRHDADFLRDAAIFYRAIDHALRISSGQPEGSLPSSDSQIELVTELVHRWTPEHLNRQPLRAQLTQIRLRTREVFERMFTL